MAPPLTDEEHEARAMLLGAKWKSWLRCYVISNSRHDGRPLSSTETWLDDETMEELTHDQKWRRMQSSLRF